MDLQSCAAPVARHFIKHSDAEGAAHVRKMPGNARVTLVELFDQRGSYIPSAQERKVESTFFREDFARTDPDDLGVIDIAGGAVEGYQADYLRLLGLNWSRKRLRVVCDYGYSPYAVFMPAMLARMGVDSLSLNTYVDAKSAPRTRQEIDGHMSKLRSIVASLSYDMGLLFTDEGERMTLVDDHGEILSGNRLFAVLCTLVAQTQHHASFAMSVTAPDRLVDLLRSQGCEVLRTKSDTRSLMKASLDSNVTFAGDERGGFIFQEFHPGFDAAYAFGKLATMLRLTGLKLSEIVANLPPFQLAYEQVRCPWEAKGAVMRRISEEAREEQHVDTLDGIKIYDHDKWVLILPDAIEPLFHVYAESPDNIQSEQLVGQFVRRIEEIQSQGPEAL
jgi:mannose-1-phosphate guanylyltransferase/phosphomannomutase